MVLAGRRKYDCTTTTENMASQSATSKVRVGRTTDYRRGTDTELIAFRDGDPTKLLLLHGERPAELFRSGSFGVHMIRAKENPVAMAVCMVGDHQWMMAKDALVLRVEPLRYLFALPGYFYGLVVSCSVSAEECRTLEQIFSRFCMYRELGQGSSNPSEVSSSDTDLWNNAYTEAIKLTIQAAKTRSQPTLATVATSAAAVDVSSESSAAVTRKAQRAVRTSAVVKLMSRTLLTGALDPIKHFYFAAGGGLKLPSMSSISYLLDTTEARTIQAEKDVQQLEAPGDFWYMNPDGVKLMLMVLSACSATGARKRPRQALDTLEEEPEEPAAGGSSAQVGGGARDDRDDASSNSLRCSDRGGTKGFPKRLDVYRKIII